MKKLLCATIPLFLFAFIFFLSIPQNSSAQTASNNFSERKHEGVVIRVLEDKLIEVSPGINQPYQKLEVQITNHELKGQKIIAEMPGLVVTNEKLKARPGDRIMITQMKKPDGTDKFYAGDFIRRNSLYFLLIAFFASVVIVGGFRGLASFIGLIISFFILLKYIIPQIVAGGNPVFIAISGSFMILFSTLYLAHGISKKTTAALIGTIISLTLAGVLAWYFVNLLRLSGMGSEEAAFLSIIPGVNINLQGILLAGIIIGALGVLDDITVSQAACVFELKAANKNLSWIELYKRGLRIGQDHIASLVNTLVLAYAGASLPMLLLFATSGGEPVSALLNREIIANEVVRTLVGSLALVAAVPITTAVAAILSKK